jgi:hypothetical protein
MGIIDSWGMTGRQARSQEKGRYKFMHKLVDWAMPAWKKALTYPGEAPPLPVLRG